MSVRFGVGPRGNPAPHINPAMLEWDNMKCQFCGDDLTIPFVLTDDMVGDDQLAWKRTSHYPPRMFKNIIIRVVKGRWVCWEKEECKTLALLAKNEQ